MDPNCVCVSVHMILFVSMMNDNDARDKILNFVQLDHTNISFMGANCNEEKTLPTNSLLLVFSRHLRQLSRQLEMAAVISGQ